MSLELPSHSRSLVPSSPFASDNQRPSQESQAPILRPAPAAQSIERPAAIQTSSDGHRGHDEYEPSQAPYEQHRDEPPRNRYLTRWGPRDDWDYDHRDDRRYRGERSSFDQGPFRRENEYYDDNYYSRPYRRRPSVRVAVSRTGSRAMPPPRNPARKMPDFEETYEDEETEQEREKPRRMKKRSRSFDSDGSPPPDVIYRLPYLDWMNSSLKNRKSRRQKCD